MEWQILPSGLFDQSCHVRIPKLLIRMAMQIHLIYQLHSYLHIISDSENEWKMMAALTFFISLSSMSFIFFISLRLMRNFSLIQCACPYYITWCSCNIAIRNYSAAISVFLWQPENPHCTLQCIRCNGG